jgi:hypothetical protein
MPSHLAWVHGELPNFQVLAGASHIDVFDDVQGVEEFPCGTPDAVVFFRGSVKLTIRSVGAGIEVV